jgi:hypothetical protein
MLGGPPGIGGLGRVLLRQPQLSDSLGQRGESCHENHQGHRPVVADYPARQQPRRPTQAVPSRRRPGNPPVRSAGRPIVAVAARLRTRLPTAAAIACRVSEAAQAASAALPGLLAANKRICAEASPAVRAAISQAPTSSLRVNRSSVNSQRRRSRGKVRFATSFPPADHTGRPSPLTSPAMRVHNR